MVLSGLVRDTGLLGGGTTAEPGRADVPVTLRAHQVRLAGPHASLLATLTCPASRLEDLLACREAARLPFVLVMDTGAADLPRAVARVYEEGRGVLAGVEVPLRPDDDQGPRAAKAARALGHLPAGVPGWVEVHPTRGWRDALGLIAARGRSARLRAGAGPAEVRPSAAELAMLIRACVREGVDFTCSPGGHRAVPEGGPPGRPVHHGLLNVVLSVCRAVDGGAVEDVTEVLTRRDPADLFAELAETDLRVLALARQRLRTVGCDDVDATLLDLENLGLAAKTATRQGGAL